MVVKFFDSPDGVRNNNELFIFATEHVLSFEYEKNFTKAGSFELGLSFERGTLEKLYNNALAEINGEWLIIESIGYDYKKIYLTGHGLGSVLNRRVSTFIPDAQEPGTQGYDAVSGTTAQCIEHYINNNFISPADEEREMPMSFIAGGVTGIVSDGYMARLENCADIITELCENAGIGFETDLSGGIIRIILKNTVDKSIGQSDRPRVIFSAERGNVTEISFEHSTGNYYNAVYATGADVTQTVYRRPWIIPEGIDRRECATDVSVESVEDIRDYALKAVENNTETHSYDLAVPSGDYGRKYEIGDIVTIEEKELGRRYTATITAVQFSFSAEKKNVRITLDRAKPKLLNTIINNVMNKTARRN